MDIIVAAAAVDEPYEFHGGGRKGEASTMQDSDVAVDGGAVTWDDRG